MSTTTSTPYETLIDALDSAKTCACVGIDPVLERIPEDVPGESDLARIQSFCLGTLESAAQHVRIVKPQSACFERYGSPGYTILERVIARARELDLYVILDAKRGDIGSSATHYAVGASNMGAHWITCSPYMGRSSIEPFLNEDLGVFALCKTSNPDAQELQAKSMTGGGDVSDLVGSMITSMGTNVGAVVGATNNHEDLTDLRKSMPDTMFLVPGVGAQGGTIDDVRAMIRPNASSPGELGVVINASRSVIFPDRASGESWEESIARASGEFACQCAALHTA